MKSFKDNFKEILSLIVVLGGGAMLILGPDNLQNALFALIASTISYWVGSSSGSNNKDKTIAKMLAPETEPCQEEDASGTKTVVHGKNGKSDDVYTED